MHSPDDHPGILLWRASNSWSIKRFFSELVHLMSGFLWSVPVEEQGTSRRTALKHLS